MNVEQEITRVAERYIDLINSYPEESQRLVPCDHIDSKEIVIEIRAFSSLADNIYRQLPSKDDHRNLTIILHSDGAPVVNVSSTRQMDMLLGLYTTRLRTKLSLTSSRHACA
jgi:hypothetical protein